MCHKICIQRYKESKIEDQLPKNLIMLSWFTYIEPKAMKNKLGNQPLNI